MRQRPQTASVAALAACAALLAAAGGVMARERERFSVHAPAADVEKALERALDFLEGQQQPEGFWQNNARTMRERTTTWALLAYLANGHTAQHGPYRHTVAKGLAWLAANAGDVVLKPHRAKAEALQPNAFQAQTLFVFLAALGMDPDGASSEDLVLLCEKGIEQVLEFQTRNQEGAAEKNALEFAAGGFGQVETSYWLSLCLLAARQSGLRVPRQALDDLCAFWKRHYQPQHGSFFDALEVPRIDKHFHFQDLDFFGDPSRDYGPVFTPRILIVLALLGEALGREAQGGLEPLRKLDVLDREWWWNFGNDPYGPMAPAPPSKWSGRPRNRMRGLDRYLGERFLAMKLCGVSRPEMERERETYATILLANQLENGSFRFPGWEFSWPVHLAYGSEHWVQDLGYGKGWSETMITAHAAYALALPKSYLPVFDVWRESPEASR